MGEDGVDRTLVERVQRGDKRVGKNPAGYLVASIRSDYQAPAEYLPPAEAERLAEAESSAAEAERRRRRQARAEAVATAQALRAGLQAAGWQLAGLSALR